MSRVLIDSGVDWIGKIPSTWKIDKTKRHFFNKKEVAGLREPDFERLALTLNGVIKRSKEDNEGLQPEQFYTYQILYANELVFKLIDLQNVKTSRVGLTPWNGLVSPAYIKLSAKGSIISEYAKNYFLTLWHNNVFNHIGGDGVRSSLSVSDLLNIELPYPSNEEQNKIVDVVAKKSEQIDRLIKIQEQQIEKLREYKQSIISNLVTRGLNGHASLKESGIEWIGKIPTHWEIRRLKYCISRKLEYGANASGLAFEESLPRYIRITDISLDNELKDTDKLSLSEKDSSRYILHDGDVLFARSGATVGKSFLYKKEYGRSAFAGYLIRATVDRNILSSEYLYYFTLSNEYWEWAKGIFIQATIQNIGANRYANMPLTVPPLDEQDKIIEKIKKFESNIKLTLRLIEKNIEKLNEYKKSIIYEYVTGKQEAI